MNQLIMYVPLTDYSSCQTSENAHEYIIGLKKCLLDELKQSEEGSGVTGSNIAYDENLHMSMKFFWDLFGAGEFTQKVTCTACDTLLKVSNHSVNYC
jgi:hypothetical protein